MDISDWYFNINSTDQMKEFLYEFLNLEPVKKTKSDKNISVDEEVINIHAERDKIKFCELLVNYRKLLKAKNTYLKDIFRNISFDTDCIHPSLWLNTTTTMRGSGTNPNITNQPKHGEIIPGLDWKIIRKLFSLKPEEMNDYFFAEVDYEQSEMKVTGMLSSDPQLIEDLNSDFDFHSHWAIELFGLKGLSYSEVKAKYDDTYRFLAKNNFTFADIFGAVNTSIAREMRKSPFYIEYVQGIYNQISNRKEKFDKFFVDYSEQQVLNCQNARKERYPIYTAWQESIVTNYYQTGYVEDPFGFRRNYPLTRNEIINKPIQSTSFLLLLDSLINIEKEVDKDPDYWKCYLIGQVHDSGVSKVNKYQAGDWIDMVDEKMTYKPHLPWTMKVRMDTDWSYGKDWFKMFKVKEYKRVK